MVTNQQHILQANARFNQLAVILNIALLLFDGIWVDLGEVVFLSQPLPITLNLLLLTGIAASFTVTAIQQGTGLGTIGRDLAKFTAFIDLHSLQTSMINVTRQPVDHWNKEHDSYPSPAQWLQLLEEIVTPSMEADVHVSLFNEPQHDQELQLEIIPMQEASVEPFYGDNLHLWIKRLLPFFLLAINLLVLTLLR